MGEREQLAPLVQKSCPQSTDILEWVSVKEFLGGLLPLTPAKIYSWEKTLL
jgi:hypothetical protein